MCQPGITTVTPPSHTGPLSYAQPKYPAMYGRIRMAGEAGDEVVGGKDKLMEYISEAVASQNGSMAEILMAILRAVQALDAGLLQKFMLALEAMQFNVNGREFARLVRSANGT